MSKLTRDGTAEPVSRDQILWRERERRNIIFSVQLTTELDWQLYPFGPYSAKSANYTHVRCSFFAYKTNIQQIYYTNTSAVYSNTTLVLVFFVFVFLLYLTYRRWALTCFS